jgi:hypothetical protein
MEPAGGFQSPLHDEHSDQGANACFRLSLGRLRTGWRRNVRGAVAEMRDGRLKIRAGITYGIQLAIKLQVATALDAG